MTLITIKKKKVIFKDVRIQEINMLEFKDLIKIAQGNVEFSGSICGNGFVHLVAMNKVHKKINPFGYSPTKCSYSFFPQSQLKCASLKN